MPSFVIENYTAKSWRVVDYRDPSGVPEMIISPKNLYRLKTIGDRAIRIETIEGRLVIELTEELLTLLGWNPTDHENNTNMLSKIIFE
jgi:hypothetical protein